MILKHTNIVLFVCMIYLLISSMDSCNKPTPTYFTGKVIVNQNDWKRKIAYFLIPLSFGPRRDKTCFRCFRKVVFKPACSATETS